MSGYLDTQQLCKNASWYEYGMDYNYEAKHAKKVRTSLSCVLLSSAKVLIRRFNEDFRRHTNLLRHVQMTDIERNVTMFR